MIGRIVHFIFPNLAKNGKLCLGILLCILVFSILIAVFLDTNFLTYSLALSRTPKNILTEDNIVDYYYPNFSQTKFKVKEPSPDIIVDSNNEKFSIIYQIVPDKKRKYLYTNKTLSSSFPVLSLFRKINNNGKNVIIPLVNKEINKDTKSFEDKKDNIVWRGSNAGGYKRIGIEKWSQKYNVGFNKFDSKKYKGSNDLRIHAKSNLSIMQQLDYKYILMLEGNSVPKGLKQALGSNSVVFMPKPTIESSLLESKLRPYVHYIPVKSDLSDLERKLNWAKKSPEIVKDIIKRANDYVIKIDKLINEDTIKQILNKFSKNVIIVEK